MELVERDRGVDIGRSPSRAHRSRHKLAIACSKEVISLSPIILRIRMVRNENYPFRVL